MEKMLKGSMLWPKMMKKYVVLNELMSDYNKGKKNRKRKKTSD